MLILEEVWSDLAGYRIVEPISEGNVKLVRLVLMCQKIRGWS